MMDVVLSGIMSIFILHFIGDYMLQSDWMATNKSKKTSVLLAHVGIYSLPFIFMAIFLGFELMLAFIGINAVAHFITDFFSSRAAGYFWGKGDRHNFFVILGIDQTIHYLTLITSFVWLLGVWPH